MRRVRALDCLLALLLFPACHEGEPERVGAVSAAVVTGQELRLYLGQPGVAADLAAIDAARTNLPYHWWRLSLPRSEVAAGRTATIDLGARTPGVEYWEFFSKAPGCAEYPSAWLGKWKAGDPGVSGRISVQQVENEYLVDYEFRFEGTREMPCGTRTGRHTSTNAFAVVLP
jgi:hypothetical protein